METEDGRFKKGLNKEDGYERGISPGMSLFRTCQKLGIKEMSFTDLRPIIRNVLPYSAWPLQKHALPP